MDNFRRKLESGDTLEMWTGCRVDIVYLVARTKETNSDALIELNSAEREELIDYLIAMRAW